MDNANYGAVYGFLFIILPIVIGIGYILYVAEQSEKEEKKQKAEKKARKKEKKRLKKLALPNSGA